MESKREVRAVDRFRQLCEDHRSRKQRFSYSILVGLFFSFTFFIYAPMDIFAGNAKFLTFELSAITMPLVVFALIVLVVISLTALVLKGKIFDLLMGSVFALTIASYIQGNFLNLNLGSLDGEAILWNKFKAHAVTNLFIWIVMILLPFVIYYFSKQIWGTIVRIVSGGLVLLQVVSLVSTFAVAEIPAMSTSYLSTENMYEISGEKNVIVFVLDYFDQKYIDELLADDSDFFAPLDGFTSYRNVVGSYNRTFPAMTYLLTGKRPSYDIPYLDYMNQSFEQSTFLSDINELGYEANLYIPSYSTVANCDVLEGLAQNLKRDTVSIDRWGLAKGMLTLSAYRYAPHSMKANFWMYTEDLDQYVNTESDDQYNIDDEKFYQDLRTEKLSTSDKNKFIMFHQRGAHPPYKFNEEMRRSDQATLQSQAKGAFNLVFEYIEQMKQAQAYQDSTIIITADHGIAYYDYDVKDSTNPIFFYKPAGKALNTPMETSYAPVSHEDFQATVIDAMGGSYEQYGLPVTHFAEGQERERLFWMTVGTPDKETTDGFVRRYRIKEDATNFDNWEQLDETEIQHRYYN